MANQGWISIHRKIQECFLWVDSEPFDHRSAWIDLLLLANHEDKKTMFDGKVVTINRGERLTSILALSERWHWSRHKVSNFLNTLESEQMIVQKRDNKKTLISIVNYDIYQTLEVGKGQQKDNRRTTEGQQKDITGTSEGHQKDTNNNDNNDNNENNENNIIPPISPQGEWNFDKHTNLENLKHILNESLFEDTEYLNNNRDVYEAIKTWMEYKDSRKPRSSNHYSNEKSVCTLLKQFVKYARENGSWAVEGLVEKSLSGNYMGIVWDYKKDDRQNHNRGNRFLNA